MINSKVKVIKKLSGHYGRIGTVIGKEKVDLTMVSPGGFLYRVRWDDNYPDSLFLPTDLVEQIEEKEEQE